MSIRRIGACAALVVALALPATASAAKLKLDGKVKGIPDSRVSVGAKKRDGAIKKVTSMKFRGVPVSCSDGSTGAINGNMPTMRVRRNNFAAKTSIEGTGIESGVVRVSGQFRRGGRVVKGDVRFTFEAKSGASCTTDKRRFKASA
jgi:acylphosphatase